VAFALVSSNKGSASDTATTTAIDSTGADLLVIGITADNGAATIGTPTDSKSNTWLACTDQSVSSSVAGLRYAESPTVGSSHTASYTTVNKFPAMALLAFSGAKASSALDQQNRNSGTGTNSRTPGSITPSEDNCLIVTVLNFEGTIAGLSIDSGFTIVQSSDFLANGEGFAIAYKVQTTAAAVNPTWSWTTNRPSSAVIASFKSAAAASSIKTINGLARASVKTINGLAIASVKKFLGLA